MLSCFWLCLVSDNSCTAKIMHFNFHWELDFVLDQRLSNCKNAMQLVRISIASVFLLILYCVLIHDLFSVYLWEYLKFRNEIRG